MTKCYMIVLQGQGDAQICYVSKATWDWIHNEKTAPPENQLVKLIDPKEWGQYSSMMPTLDEAVEQLTQWGGSSGDNDRALNTRGDYGDSHYFTMKEAMKAARVLNLEVVDSFEGYIY